jgi:hypothetical protein
MTRAIGSVALAGCFSRLKWWEKEIRRLIFDLAEAIGGAVT